MKNVKVFVVLFIYGIVFFGCNEKGSVAVHAQSSNNEQRLIGTWINDLGGGSIVFNTDGSMSGRLFGSNVIRHVAIGDKLLIAYDDDRGNNWVYDFRISSNGRQLIIFYHDGRGFSFRKQ